MSLRVILRNLLLRLLAFLERHDRPLREEPQRFRRKLTRDDLLRLIEASGKVEGLDLTEMDLSSLDLGLRAMRREMNRWRQAHPNGHPPWFYEPSGGVNLAGTVLAMSDLRCTNLFGANLQAAILCKCDLRGADLRRATLVGADLFDARIEETLMERSCLSGKLPQEKANHVSWLTLVPPRLQQANEIYRELRQNFQIIGRHDDASWAYVKQRKMETAMYSPCRARLYFGDAYPFGRESFGKYESLSRWHPFTWWFWVRYFFKWLPMWLAEQSCGYGESLGRTAVSMVVLFVLFIGIYWATWSVMKVEYSPDATRLVPTRSLKDLAIFGLGAFTTMDPEGLEPRTVWVQFVAGLEALLGIGLTGLLGFVLGNRIRRS